MVHHFLHSAEQDALVQNKNGIVNVSYKNKETALHTMLLRIMANVIHGKSTLLVIHSYEDRKKLENLLHDVSLGQVMLSIQPDEIANEEDLQHIGQKITRIRDLTWKIDETSGFLHQKKEQEILDFYRTLYVDHIWEGESWRKILDTYVGLHTEKNINILHAEMDLTRFEFSPDELHALRSGIEEALYLYQSEFEIIESSEKSKNIHAKLISIENIEKITFDLFALNEYAQNLRDQYYTCFQKIEKTFQRDAEIWASDMVKKIDLLIFKIEKYQLRTKDETKSIFTPFNEKKKEVEAEKWQLIHDFNHLVTEVSAKNIFADHRDTKVPADALPNLVHFKQQVLEWQTNTHKRYELFIKAANKLNTDDQRFNELESELKILLKKINDANIFEDKLELNTLSFKKQLEFISNLVYDIDLFMARVEKNLPYYQWMSFLDDLDEKSRNLIRILRRFDPSTWLSTFESWYHYEVLIRHSKGSFYLNDKTFEEAEYFFIQNQQMKIDQSLSLLSKQIGPEMQDLKNSNPALYQTLVKKKKFNHPTIWKYLLSQNASFFSHIFPIILLDSDHIDTLSLGIFSDLIYFEPEGNNLEILQSFEHIISFYNTERPVSNTEHLLSLEKLENPKTLSEVSMTERLKLVRHLAEEMLQFGRQPVIFHLRHACVISFCSDLINDEINHFLYDFGIKKLQTDASVFETITGTMLDPDRAVFILIENLLIDPIDHINLYLWQRNVLGRLESAGCNILNIDTSVLLETKGKNLIGIFDKIKGNQIPKTDHKNQFILELN